MQPNTPILRKFNVDALVWNPRNHCVMDAFSKICPGRTPPDPVRAVASSKCTWGLKASPHFSKSLQTLHYPDMACTRKRRPKKGLAQAVYILLVSSIAFHKDFHVLCFLQIQSSRFLSNAALNSLNSQHFRCNWDNRDRCLFGSPFLRFASRIRQKESCRLPRTAHRAANMAR